MEAYASRTAVAKQILADVNRGIETMVQDKIDMTKGILRSKTLAQAVEANDLVVVRAINDAAVHLGQGLATVMNLLNPRRIIIGGGLVEAVPYFFQVAAEEAKYKALRIACKNVEIVKAELGDFAGIVGAALLVKKQK